MQSGAAPFVDDDLDDADRADDADGLGPDADPDADAALRYLGCRSRSDVDRRRAAASAPPLPPPHVQRHGAAFASLPAGVLSCLLGTRVLVQLLRGATAEGELAATDALGNVMLRNAVLSLPAAPDAAIAALHALALQAAQAAAVHEQQQLQPQPHSKLHEHPQPLSQRIALAAVSLRAGAVQLVFLMPTPPNGPASGAVAAAAGAAIASRVVRHMRELDAARVAASGGTRKGGGKARGPQAEGPALGLDALRPRVSY